MFSLKTKLSCNEIIRLGISLKNWVDWYLFSSVSSPFVFEWKFQSPFQVKTRKKIWLEIWVFGTLLFVRTSLPVPSKIGFIFISCIFSLYGFRYLSAFDIFYSFNRLNYYLNKLIRNILLYLDFQYIQEIIFDKFCLKILLNPEMMDE
jgi:hypothetical protein